MYCSAHWATGDKTIVITGASSGIGKATGDKEIYQWLRAG
jgi:NADP-dependent 3-hydroxy acid dehydrogenase YdfG